MTKTKNTKKSLLASMLSMLICIAMLIGSTFAWFTDSVTSSRNKITAGNLDIELYHGLNTEAADKVTEETKLFEKGIDGTELKWEPGVVAYENFTVKNEGSLALKYSLALNVAGNNTVDGEKSLADVIKVAFLNRHFDGTREEAQALTDYQPLKTTAKNGELFPEEKDADRASEKFAIVLYWQPGENDNDYNLNNGKTSSDKLPLWIDLGVDLYATQYTYESDSFGTDYDADAFNPDERVLDLSAKGYTPVDSADDIPENAEKVVLNGNITLDEIKHFADGAVFDANGYTITVDQLYAFGNSASASGAEKGAEHITIKNAVIEKGTAWGISVGNGVTFENCTFNGLSPYITPGIDTITVKNCVFNDTLLQICWAEGTNKDPSKGKVEIIGNTFNYTATSQNDHAIALNAGKYFNFASVTVSGNTFNNKGVAAFSALYMTTEDAEKIAAHYGSDNKETNASVGYHGNNGYGRSVVEEDAAYVVYDSKSKVLVQVTAETKDYTISDDVTKIGDMAFAENETVKNVIVPDSVTDLGRGFDSSSVESVTLPDGLETISSRAFRRTPNLKELKIPSTVKTIEENAFQSAGIEKIVIPESVTSIGFAGLAYCDNLTTVTIEGNPVIENYAFRACPNLENVYLKGDDVSFAENCVMVFTVAENNSGNSQITIHVVNDTVRARVAKVVTSDITILNDLS